MFKWLAAAFLVVLISVGTASGVRAQTFLDGGPGGGFSSFNGYMFDVTASQNLTIVGLTHNILPGPVRIWGRPGTHVGFETSSIGWTLLATGATAGGGRQTLPAISVPLTAGSTYAFYIEADQAVYYRGTANPVGSVQASDAALSIRRGTGLQTAFNTPAQPREMDGGVSYLLPPTPVPTLSEWAMILFAGLMATGAALYLQRRRSIG